MRNPATEKLLLDNWPIRRRWLRLALVWMVINVQAILIAGYFKIEIASSPLHQNAMITMLTAIVSLMGFYVFGSVWDDNDKRRGMRHHRPDFGFEADADEPTPSPRALDESDEVK